MKKNKLFLILSLTVIFAGLNITPETFLSHKTLQVPNLGLVQLTKLLGPILSVKSCNHSDKHIKPNSIFHWTVELDKLFSETKTDDIKSGARNTNISYQKTTNMYQIQLEQRWHWVFSFTTITANVAWQATPTCCPNGQ